MFRIQLIIKHFSAPHPPLPIGHWAPPFDANIVLSGRKTLKYLELGVGELSDSISSTENITRSTVWECVVVETV